MSEGRAPNRSRYGDFTERSYVALLRAAKARYRFARFGSTPRAPHILLRHDVDMSVHRALRLASLEAAHGVRATYFFLLRSEFYNLLEPPIAAMVRRIATLGHDIGLHFAAGAPGAPLRAAELAHRASAERALLAATAGAPVRAVSFHDPTPRLLARFDQPRFAGMHNAYAARLRARYKYCSDSNGYWRFERPVALLDPSMHPRLHLLMHPEWWVPQPLSPFARVRRCIDGRRDATLAHYVAELRRDGRRNVGAPRPRQVRR